MLGVDCSCCARLAYIAHAVGVAVVGSVGNWRDFVGGGADDLWVEGIDTELEVACILAGLADDCPDKFFRDLSEAAMLSGNNGKHQKNSLPASSDGTCLTKKASKTPTWPKEPVHSAETLQFPTIFEH